jgi:hypothetical protein
MTPAKDALSDVEGTPRMDEKESTKSEARNPKQFQMTKTSKFQTNSIRIRGFEYSPILDLFGLLFVSDFDIRISGFVST